MTKKEFVKPTKEKVNEAIKLLFWRCRDARLFNNGEGYYKLQDWISTAYKSVGVETEKFGVISGKNIVKELELFLSDIQEIAIGDKNT